MNPSRICAGGGKYGSGYVDGVYIYGVDAESGKSTRLAGLLDCGIDENELSGCLPRRGGGHLLPCG